jgi:myosin heavy subunit
MRIRHRTPTIFNLSMVDVLCCALGCIIMLWLLNLQEAKEKSISASLTSEELAETKAVVSSQSSVVRKLTTDNRQLTTDLDAARRRLVSTEQSLAALRAENQREERRLALLAEELKAVTGEKAEVSKEAGALRALVRDQESSARQTRKELAKATDLLRKTMAQSKQLQELAAQMPALQADVKTSRTSLAALEEKLRAVSAQAEARQSELSEDNKTIAALERDKKTLLEQVVRIKNAVENRFEGIALTGKRVIFLVDMSGSMELVDERTPDENKWLRVRETLAKIMRSLPELSRFQVIVFSDRISYLLGGENRWLDFDARTSVNQAYAALSRIRPRGATNMYDAFEAAFRYRPLGLDTIYVLSDGLPNVGPGLTPEQANLPSENERSSLLARHIRSLLQRDWNRPVNSQPKVKINTIGFFFESPDVGAFLWALARENDGSFVGMSKP